eukprot:1746724-Amphidinium_carterae.1
MLHAIPGFLAASKGFVWCMSQGVALISTMLTAVALPVCSKRAASQKLSVSEAELLAVGKLL